MSQDTAKHVQREIKVGDYLTLSLSCNTIQLDSAGEKPRPILWRVVIVNYNGVTVTAELGDITLTSTIGYDALWDVCAWSSNDNFAKHYPLACAMHDIVPADKIIGCNFDW